MLSTSTAYRVAMANGADVRLKATLYLADGSTMELVDDDFTMGGLTVSEAVSASNRFEVGAAVVGSGTVTLSNFEGKFDEVDFTGATIIPYIGIEMADGTVEWLRRATWNVEQPASYGATIKLECLDNLSLLDKPFADVPVQFPATVQVLADAICTACGVSFLGGEFPNRGYTFLHRPEQDMSCRDALSYIAQAAGDFAKCDTAGHVLLGWYSLPETTEASLDGGTYRTSTTPYSDGDSADGGGFMTGGGSYDGGAFGTAVGPVISDTKSLTVLTDDVVITGVRVTAASQVTQDGTAGADGETVLAGAEGYVLTISGNPFIEYGRASEVAQNIMANAGGMRFRPLQCSAIGDPSYEASDPAVVFGIKGDMHFCWLTRITWKAGDFEDFSCDAEPAARNLATGYAARTEDDALKRMVRAEKTAREAAIAQVQRELATSSGLYVTPVLQPDGSTIYYAHDKAQLSESTIVWKMTAEAIGISTDGGLTYPYALDVNGTAILNRIYAIGIDADYVTTGRIQDAHGYNFWDLDTGEFQMASTALIGGKTAAQIAQGAVDAQTQSDIFNKLTNNGALQGLYMSNGNLYINATYIVAGKISSVNGKVYFDLDNNELRCDRLVSTDTSNAIVADVSTANVLGYQGYGLRVYKSTDSSKYFSLIPPGGFQSGYDYTNYGVLYSNATKGFMLMGNGLRVNVDTFFINASESDPATNMASSSRGLSLGGPRVDVVGNTTVTGSFVVNGSKNRAMVTENYGERLLYCYETPAPLFGDIGGGVLDDDGECVVMFDPVFAETVDTGIEYRVFLQKCGEGDVWVDSKGGEGFIVKGTPGLAFDWEVKALQVDLAMERLEVAHERVDEQLTQMGMKSPEAAYGDYVLEIEGLYGQELAA